MGFRNRLAPPPPRSCKAKARAVSASCRGVGASGAAQ
jgi:hypothetical protein